jgi:1,4-dihydroxy-2-naphthoate octaprenyltransferase
LTLWAAARPSQVALVLVVYCLGVGMATAGPPFADGPGVSVSGADPGTLARVVSGGVVLVAVAVAVHYANEYADADTDALTEGTPFSGGSGALARTGLPPAFLRRATLVAAGASLLALAATAGGRLPLDAVAVGVAILALGLAYSLPPVALVRRGVGEAVNASLGGVMLPLYGVSVVGRPTAVAALAVVPFALVVGCNLLATHWPDRAADAAVGKRTLAVRWRARSIRRAYAVLGIGAAAVTLVLSTVGLLPAAVAVAHLAAVPFLLWGWTTLTRRRSPLPPVLAMVALAAATTAAWWWVALGG